jgi:uncharacterized transporter YbjL
MSTPAAPPKGKIRQIFQAYRITKKQDKHLGLVLLAWFLGVGLLVGAIGWFLHPVFGVVMGFLTGFTALMLVFGRRA